MKNSLFGLSPIRGEGNVTENIFNSTAINVIHKLRVRERYAYPDSEEPAAALKYIANMRATGGTAIDSALRDSLKQFRSPQGTNIIVFLTDGLPTVGTTDIRRIMSSTVINNANKARIFILKAV